MDFQHKISVIVCTYNQETTIGRTLDSILSQKCSWPVEIIIGEDCSTDRTRQVCREYADRYPGQIRLIENLRNKGLCDNYFDCLLKAEGTYIAELAGDDEWCDPMKLEKELTILEQHPEVVLVHTDYQLRNESDGKIEPSPANPYPKDASIKGSKLTPSILTQTRRPVIHLCTAMYRNESFRNVYSVHSDLFRSKNLVCEDLPFMAILSTQGDFAYIDEVTLTYSIGTTLSHTCDETRQFHFVRSCTQLSYDLIQRLQLPMDRTFHRYFSYRVFAMMMHAFRTHDEALRLETRKCAARWNARLELRTLLIALLTSNNALWNAALFCRKQLLQLIRN